MSLRSNGNGRFGSFATLRYVGEQNEDDLGLLILGDALTLDAGLSWRISRAISIEARGENLTDTLVSAVNHLDRRPHRILTLADPKQAPRRRSEPAISTSVPMAPPRHGCGPVDGACHAVRPKNEAIAEMATRGG